MLVLKRRRDETLDIVVGGVTVSVTVVWVAGKAVGLAIEAPPTVQVFRREITPEVYLQENQSK